MTILILLPFTYLACYFPNVPSTLHLETTMQYETPIQQFAQRIAMRIAVDDRERSSGVIEALRNHPDVEPEQAGDLLRRLQDARAVVEAENPAEAFRNGVRQSIQMAKELGLESAEDIEKLVRQICYRASDLAYLLKVEESSLSRYSRHLRREPDVEYHDGYFDEED